MYGPRSYISYDKIKEAFANFQFAEGQYIGVGQIKNQSAGRCRYAVVKIIIEKAKYVDANFQWLVDEGQIPTIFLDVILSTIKIISAGSQSSSTLKIKIVEGSYHAVDSCEQSYEIATYRAMADLINFQL